MVNNNVCFFVTQVNLKILTYLHQIHKHKVQKDHKIRLVAKFNGIL